ncbi:MAG: MFS transporter [Eggerthellaceae bacterium]|nr:MFS transporter [Eggerthellaceae bacterium]
MDDSIIMKPPYVSKTRLWVALAAILLGQFVVSIDLTILNIALPEIAREVKPTSDQLLWIVDIYSLILAGFLIATSSLSDRFGRKKMLLTGFLIFGIGSLLVLLVTEPEQLIAIRAFLGIGGAMIMPVTISMIRSIFIDSKDRAIAVAAWSAVSAVGMAVGPLLGGFLLEHFNWHSAFLINVPLVGAAFLLGVFAMPEVRLKNPGRFDIIGSLVALAGMVALLWGIKHLAAELEFDLAGVSAVVVGLILMALFMLRCLKAKNPLVDLSLFRSKTFTAGVIATMACTFALAVLLYMLAQWLQLVNGDSTLESGLHLIPMSIATLISSLGAAALAMRYQARHVVAGGLSLAAAAMIMLFFFRHDVTLVPVIVSTCMVGLGTGSLAIGASLIMAETPIDKASSAGSLQEISYDLGNVLGVAILGSFASIVYRADLGSGALRAMGLDSVSIDAAQQSFAATIEIAQSYGLPELVRRGAQAFDESLVLTCMVGGVIILITALVVWRLIPKGLKITEDATDEVAIPESYQLEDKKVLQLEEGTKRSDEERTFQLQEGAKRPEREEIQEEVKDYSTDELFISDVKVDVSSTKAMMKKVGVEVVRVPLDSESVSILEDACTKAGIDLTTAFIIFAKKVVQEKHLPWESCD